MYAAHTARLITRWVLLWFGLSLAAAIASPLLHPQAAQMVCSSAGIMKLVVQTDDGFTEVVGLALDCPLCAHVGAPPPTLAQLLAAPLERTFYLLPLQVARIAALLRSPLQARAPPHTA